MKYIVVFIAGIVFFSCQPKRKPIIYGQDTCDYCWMSIVDQRFGGEIVTQKSKVFKFDAVECMINYLDERVEDRSEIELILTNAYDNPGKLVNAEECHYLKSKNMPSPMGMFINPFEDSSEALKNQREHTGTIYKWEELRTNFTVNK